MVALLHRDNRQDVCGTRYRPSSHNTIARPFKSSNVTSGGRPRPLLARMRRASARLVRALYPASGEIEKSESTLRFKTTVDVLRWFARCNSAKATARLLPGKVLALDSQSMRTIWWGFAHKDSLGLGGVPEGDMLSSIEVLPEVSMVCSARSCGTVSQPLEAAGLKQRVREWPGHKDLCPWKQKSPLPYR